MNNYRNKGFALVTVLSLVILMGVLIVSYSAITNIELGTVRSAVDSTTGFYAAEAGLNIRGEEIRSIFIDRRDVPRGTSPNRVDSCIGANQGDGDFRCQTFSVNNREVVTFVEGDPMNAGGGRLINIPQTEAFGGLNAIEQRFSAFSRANNPNSGGTEALLEMVFRSRLVPLFQFAAFYNKDLEILPGPNMTLNGRVHVNGDLYLNAGNTLDITGQITVSTRSEAQGGGGGRLYRRRKNTTECGGTVRVRDGSNNLRSIACSGHIPQSTLDAWNGQIQTGLDFLRIPEPEEFDPGGGYWASADLRIVLNLHTTPPTIFVPRAELAFGGGFNIDTVKTAALNSCTASTAPRIYTQVPGVVAGPLEYSRSFRNRREGNQVIDMLEVDVRGLLDCLHTQRNTLLGFDTDINLTTDGGLVTYFTVAGPNSNGINTYGVRLRNGARLSSTLSSAPQIQGLTVVTDQAVYIQGDYNRNTNWRPASVLADSLNILSNDWLDGNLDSRTNINVPVAANTEINAAFLSGTDTTGDIEGSGGQGGAYNGGLENYPRFHERWDGRTLTYRGSFVSLNRPRHVNGRWVSNDRTYTPPVRNWSYDTRFNDPAQLPPLSPRFVALRQELFVREFEQ
jgi:hypothetical protein